MIEHLDSLAHEPRPSGVKKLRAKKALYRIRVGDYRIVYKIDDPARTVTVTVIDLRSGVYS